MKSRENNLLLFFNFLGYFVLKNLIIFRIYVLCYEYVNTVYSHFLHSTKMLFYFKICITYISGLKTSLIFFWKIHTMIILSCISKFIICKLCLVFSDFIFKNPISFCFRKKNFYSFREFHFL